MAKLLKERARTPVIEDANAWPSLQYEESGTYFAIEVCEPWIQGGKQKSFKVLLTKAEMLRVSGKWLELLSEMETRAPK